jgi:arylsulfatase A-like enzyme
MIASKPNLILINCDDLGWGDLGAYGSAVNATPFLDRMAAEGTRLTDFYMGSPVCSPSRGGMLTGCYPPRIGFGEFDGRAVLFPGDAVGLASTEITIARLLKGAGYATRLVGKWHCGDQSEFLPTRHGFDGYFGIPFSNDMGRQAGKKPGWAKGEVPPLPLLRDEEVVQEQPDQAALTERYTEDAVSFLRKNRKGPFFLYLAHMHVHIPLYTPERFLRESKNGRYGAAVAAIDWSTGVILAELKQLGIDGNTMVVFTSDNGSRAQGEGGSNGPLKAWKGTTWEGGQRVPCLVRWPGQVPAGRVRTTLASAIDFYPTFAALAGASLPADRVIDGRDMGPLLFGKPGAKGPRDDFFYYKQNTLEAVRAGDWKLHVCKNGKPVVELYNLSVDIGETIDRAKEQPEVVAGLMARIDRCREDLGDAATETAGKNTRPIGRVGMAGPLTQWRPEHPYLIAEYDLADRG